MSIAHVDGGIEALVARASIDASSRGRPSSRPTNAARSTSKPSACAGSSWISPDEQQARDKVREQIPDLRDEEFAAWDEPDCSNIASSTAASAISIARLRICFA